MTVIDSRDADPASRERRGEATQWNGPRQPRAFVTVAQNIHSATALHREGRLHEAERLYRAVLEVNESDFDCLHNLGLLHAQERRFEDAIRLLRAGARQDPRSVEAHNDLANVLATLKRYDEAAAGFQIAIALKPDFAEAHNNLGKVLAKQGRGEEAAGHYGRALALRPDYADPYLNLGNLRHEQNRFAEAAAHYGRALAVDPRLVEAHYRLADVLGKQGKIGEATTHYERALALEPDHAEAWLGLGNAFEQAQRHHDAISAYDKASDLAEAWLGRARVLKYLNRLPEAVAAYRQALAKGGDPEVIRFFLASLGAEPAPGAAPTHLIRTVYDQHSAHYDQHMLGTLKYRIPDLLLDAMARLMPPRDLDILDLGCGTGLLGARFRPLARTLTGVDISSKMMAIARQRRIYHDLICSELVAFLQTQAGKFDLVIAADVLAYIGDLTSTFKEVRGALRESGLFGFSVEASEGRDFALGPTLRYAHSAAYLRRLSREHGFIVTGIEPKALRRENGNDVAGHIAVLRRA
jgi:predicted TPR repeat methyltransferase